MSNKILHKRSSVTGKVPLPGQLSPGELAINTTDEKLFIKNSSGDVVEVSANEESVRAAISATGDLAYNESTGVLSFSESVNSVAGKTGAVALDTADVAEGTNLYYTDARARAAIDVAGDLAYNESTGVVSFSESVNSVAGKTGIVTLDTADVSEGTNLYYTDARARAAISATGDLAYNESTGVVSFSESVNSVAGKTGAVTLVKADVGLANVDNTADLDKPISTATQSALTALGNDKAELAGSLTQDFSANNVTVAGNILPNGSNQDIGSSTARFRAIYVDDAYLSTNTLYIGDTPILGTEQDTIVIKADPDQSLSLQTSGIGQLNLVSAKGINVDTNAMNADIQFNAAGPGAQVRFGAASSVEFNAPAVNVTGAITTSTHTNIGGNLTVTGNLTINGTSTVVNSTQLAVADNIIEVNKGEVGNGVTAGRAGLRVDRGEEPDYEFVFVESDDMFKVGMLGDLETVATRPWVIATAAPLVHSHDVATTSTSGFMSSGDKSKLDGIEAGAQVNVGTNLAITGTGDNRTITSSTGTNVTVPVATTTVAGLMATGDKSKLNDIEAGAQVNVATNLGSSGTGATRTITSSTGSNTSITYSAADVGAPATSLTLTAGTGISGGGNLTANRTFSLTNIAAGSTAAGAVYYNGTTASAGRFDGGTTDPTGTTRLNYSGHLHATEFHGVATSAQYADLAEKYVADSKIEPGTVVDFGGEFEVTTGSADMSTRIAGVISTAPAYVMNSKCQGKYVVAVALQGRVPVKVIGPVRKGDMLVSAGNGYARAEEEPKLGSVIGKALENFSGSKTTKGVIEIVVGRV